MATIPTSTAERVFQIQRWLGLHESADGDTGLKMGEAAIMRNFRVTMDGKLQKRPGTEIIVEPQESDWGPCSALWSGIVAGKETVLGVFGAFLYELWCEGKNIVDGFEAWKATKIGTVGGTSDTTVKCLLFGFNNKVYVINRNGTAPLAYKYHVYDGTTLSEVTPYIPLVEVSMTSLGEGTRLESSNMLSAKRRVWLSPDGSATTFQLPEKGLASIDYAKKTTGGSAVTISSRDTANGTLTFSSAPAQGTNTIEVGYTATADFALDVLKQPYCEFYNGDQNNRIFLYGNGNKTFYSGINYDGEPDPSYFPGLNEIAVGEEGENITGLIRYNSRLLCFKETSTYSIQYGEQTLADGSATAVFYLTPVHRDIGNGAPGQVQLVMNHPISISRNIAYSWSGNSFGNMTADERQVKRISDRVYSTLGSLSSRTIKCFDDDVHSEYYIFDRLRNRAVVWNYAVDAWYSYTDIDMRFPIMFHNELYFASVGSGLFRPCICRFTTDVPYDEWYGDGKRHAIDCYWESGSMSFGKDYQRKYSAMLWIGIQPQLRAEIDVTTMTDRHGRATEKVVGHSWSTFNLANFASWSFNTSHRPKMRRLKIKAKKFVYYKLIFESNNATHTATVTAADIRVRYTGYAK